MIIFHDIMKNNSLHIFEDFKQNFIRSTQNQNEAEDDISFMLKIEVSSGLQTNCYHQTIFILFVKNTY